MEDRDNAIEIMKAAMEKEKVMKDKTKESMEEHIDAKADKKVSAEEEISTDEVANEEEQSDVFDDLSEDMEEQDDVETKYVKLGKSLFKNNKSKELAAKDQKIDELSDRLMRTMAEFDNFRKRTEKEKAQMFDYGVKSVVEKILPIADNFERGFGTITEKEKESSFAQGIEMIYKQLLTSLEEIGLKPIEAVGKEFDPALHNAVMHGEDENLGANMVSDEFQKGYVYRDIVVRHSMVKVVN